MKRSLTQKVQSASPCPADALEALSKPAVQEQAVAKAATKEGYRRARHSAFLGLAAISVGATAGVLLPNQGDEAKAVEPNLGGFPQPVEASGNPYQATPKLAESSELSAVEAEPSSLKHTVRQGDTLWDLSQTYQVPSNAIATSNNIDPSETLSLGQKLNIPTQTAPTSLQVASQPPSLDKSATLPKSAQNLVKDQSKVAQKQIAQPQHPVSSNFTESAEINRSNNADVRNPLALARDFSALSDTSTTEGFETPEEFRDSATNSVSALETETLARTDTPPLTQDSQSISIPVPQPIASDRASRPESAVSQEGTAQDLGEPRVLTPVAATEQVYRIQPGDTLDAIALRYGVSRSDLTKVNNIANPHQIQIDQELKIPQPQSAYSRGDRYETIVPEIASVPIKATEAPSQSLGNADRESPEKIAVPTEAPIVLPSDPSRRWQPAIPQAETSQTTIVANPPTTEVEIRDAREESQAAYNANPYVERLKADIERMRDEYRAQQQENQSESSVSDTANNGLERSTQAVNGEWETDRRNGSLTVRVEDRRQPLAAPQIQNLPQPQTPSQPVQVAVSPASPEQYNPLLRTVPGQSVEPQLPPLTPDRYLPDSPAKFNGYIWPTKGVLTSGYGPRWGRMHKGIDIAGPVGTPIVAAAPGEVISAGWNSGGYGNLVMIRHPDGSVTRYAHNSKVLVRKGQQVQQGQKISLMGSTGYSTGPHLHFEVHPGGSGAANPMAYLPSR